MPLDRARADEEPSADLGVREAVARETRDLVLLWRKVVAGLDHALARGRTGRSQLPRRALGERLDAHVGQHVVGFAQLAAGVHAAAGAAEPFAVHEMRAGQVHPALGSAEARDGVDVQPLRLRALAE